MKNCSKESASIDLQFQKSSFSFFFFYTSFPQKAHSSIYSSVQKSLYRLDSLSSGNKKQNNINKNNKNNNNDLFMITFGEGRGCLGCQDITQTPEALGGGLPNSSWGGGDLKMCFTPDAARSVWLCEAWGGGGDRPDLQFTSVC